MIPIVLQPEEVKRLTELADLLIPAAQGHFSASQAGIAGPLLRKIYELAPERVPLLRQVVGASTGVDAQAALDRLKAASSLEYDVFCQTVAGAYFMSPEVRQQIKYPGREPVPARADIADMEDLLMPVLEAGFAPREI
ncbi:hypothetical protein [Paraburkholderia caffeinilytica]|uniref:hypothetical protein n=1 Tax=Paraburkholderia caffeinilytica TaxID=1761016 RepID=UPI0038B84D96